MISCAMLHAYDLLFCIVCQGLFVCVSAAEQLQIDVLLRQDILVAMCIQNIAPLELTHVRTLKYWETPILLLFINQIAG